MKESTFVKKSDEPLYLQLYRYFRKLVESGGLHKGEKLMSIRRCSEEFGLSKTTVETAYLQLAAEGYIVSKPQSGYYVSDLDFLPAKEKTRTERTEKKAVPPCRFDFRSSSPDSKSFDFSIWTRYIKSALRQTGRLIGYGEYQGEYDLRTAISSYVSKYRSVVCGSDDIVVSAGTQSLIHILCSLIEPGVCVAFIGAVFEKGEAVFNDHGNTCIKMSDFPEDLNELKKKNVKLIYVSPSHFNVSGDVLSIKKRLELINFATENDCLIVEDDYDSEFRYYTKPMPSLQGIAGGKNIVYLGTFSKLLIPSIRISFMVLPPELAEKYSEKGKLYNQTASKLEQIAVCQFIRDGHLSSQIKKQRKFFNFKAETLCTEAKKVFGETVGAEILSAGYLVKLEFKESRLSSSEIAERARKTGVGIIPLETETPTVILSAASVAVSEFATALKRLKSVIY